MYPNQSEYKNINVNHIPDGSGEALHFASPEEEINYLRSKIREKEKDVENFNSRITREDGVRSVLDNHKVNEVNVGGVSNHVRDEKVSETLNNFKNNHYSSEVSELAGVMNRDGVKFAMEVASKLGLPELEDDFHRFLVSYLITEHNDKKINLDEREWKAMHLKLFEIVPPAHDPSDTKNDIKGSVQMMEQLYAALSSIASDEGSRNDNYYSLELAMSNGSSEVVFYIAVPKEIEDILEKTLQGYFPGIEVKPKLEDYNVFHDSGYQVAAIGRQSENPILPLKTYKNLEGDPITVIINSFAKLKKDGEGAGLQILVKPVGDRFKADYGKVLDRMQKDGDTFRKALERQSFFAGGMLNFKESFKSKEELDKIKEKEKSYVDQDHVKLINEKLSSTVIDTNIRLFASAATNERAKYIINDIKASFKQYSENNGNHLEFADYELKNMLHHAHDYIYRLWSDKESVPLNITELATLYHIPSYVKDYNQVKLSKMATSPAPLDLGTDGVLLGYNEYRDMKTPIHLGREDRVRHLYVIGQTGTGKTVTLKNLIIQDILNGDGCCYIDPHGDDVNEILANVPPERYDDVIYFDPAYAERPMGLNMLEYDKNYPELKTLVINEMLGIFNKLFDMKTSGGAGFEAMFRNATQLVMEHPESGNTLLEISRVLSDKDFRDYKLSKCKNPLIHQYWKNAEATTGEQGLSNWVPFINSKIDPFLTNDILRPVVAQEESAFNIRDIMDNKKILLVNLSKGRLGEINANLIGLILIGKFAQAALARASSEHRPDFYLYLDEFQNVVTDSISSILSEARKYRLSLNIAHQFLGQLPENIKNAVFGNVGSMCVSRVGPDDAAFLEKQFAPIFTASDIMRIENLNTYAKILSKGTPQKPFSMHIPFNSRGNKDVAEMLKKLSYEKYGRLRQEVEDEIMNKYAF